MHLLAHGVDGDVVGDGDFDGDGDVVRGLCTILFDGPPSTWVDQVQVAVAVNVHDHVADHVAVNVGVTR